MNYLLQDIISAVLFILLIMLDESLAQPSARITLRGAVVDAKTGRPLHNANVFIANSLKGDATNEQGFFVIRNVPEGTYQIVASVIGYEAEKQTIRITSGFKKLLIFELTPKVIPLQEVVVSAKDQKEWRNNLKKFTELLIGKTQNASETKILNPLILEFQRAKSGVFAAVANEALIIENKALGYKLYYVLEKFEATLRYVKYSGIPKFEELTPETPDQLKKWQDNRKRAYNGSLRHFITTLCTNYDSTVADLEDRKYKLTSNVNEQGSKIDYKKEDSYIEKEGFHVLWVNHPWRYPQLFELVNTNTYLAPGESPTERYLKFSDYLQIRYTREKPEDNYYKNVRGSKRQDVQVSWIKLEADSVMIDTRGRYFDKFKINTLGYWSWERLADMVPLDYQSAIERSKEEF